MATVAQDLAAKVALIIGGSRNQGAGTPESSAAATHRGPRNRLGLPSDTAPVVGRLLCDEAGWVSGQTVRANGVMR